jgi:catechol 2,3-dioxygenase-like lactoylglutathione lyase family enzyme
MIKGLFETHLYVKNLEQSIAFYSEVMGLEQCYYEEDRRSAFFWIGKPRQSMLGLWEMPEEDIDLRHFAFECDPMWILNKSVPFLEGHGLTPRNFLRDGTTRPMVFAWTPAISIYFDDPDGHSLEFIGLLDGTSRPEKGVIGYDDWLQLEGKA